MSREPKDDWDLTPVIDLIYSLATHDNLVQKKDFCATSISIPDVSTVAHTDEIGNEAATQLGNFDKLWQFLGQPLDSPPPKIDVSLDGVTYSQSPPKAVKWRDELEGAGLADNDENEGFHMLSSLTRTQRKKARRKQRLRDQSEALANGTSLPSGSEDESGDDSIIQTQDRKAIIFEMLHGTSHPGSTVGQLRSGKVFRPEPANDPGPWPIASPCSVKQTIQILKPTRNNRLDVAAEKKAKLIALLNKIFIDEQQYLGNISFTQNYSSTYATIEGIHVFVDASNIMIGFHDALKLSRGQSIAQRIRRQPLSFHNLSLILERGRPAAKRILVGSDNFPAISEAKVIGYETNILDRVHKAKELTPRQKRFSNRLDGTGTGTGSGSETTAAAAAVQYAPEKWVEQAVDEILHLKMMESIVDASEPSIMVLATGDAAEAEYSGGFLKMVDRALLKGWKVELASFRHNTSGAYKKKEFRHKWGERFRIVELDDFVELLLGED